MKETIKKIIYSSKFLRRLYEKTYLNFRINRRRNIKVYDSGMNNCIITPKVLYCDDLQIIFKGNNNTVRIGRSSLKCANTIFIQGDGNTVEIGDNVVFDQEVSLVLAEGTTVKIGDECLLAKGVRIRTSDQHSIYDETGNRINTAKDVIIGNHVWIGASAIIMKGVTIGEGSVIGMDSMVTKPIPTQSIAVGKPAKVIKSNIKWEE